MGALQVKNVPPELHDELRRRAAAAGLSLGDYVLALLRREVELPTWDEWLAEVAALPRAKVRRGAAEAALRRERQTRDEDLRRATRA